VLVYVNLLKNSYFAAIRVLAQLAVQLGPCKECFAVGGEKDRVVRAATDLLCGHVFQPDGISRHNSIFLNAQTQLPV
jgi:hypothetical protein